MDKVRVASRKPIEVELEAGEHHWCACGRSEGGTFCDGSHNGTGFVPVAFTVEKSQSVWLCMCKHTKNPPYCDGAHAELPDDLSGDLPDDKHDKHGKADQPEAQGLLAERSAIGRNTSEEPTLSFIQELAANGLTKTGHHGKMDAMGVPVPSLPQWNDIQILTAQLATKPLMDDVDVATELVVGPAAKKPLRLQIPIFVSDMSFGALSEEAKLALALGAEGAGTGICSGEGGMLPEEQQANTRYLYELASGKFGYREELLLKVQAFHFKGGQGAKTGTGGHLPGSKVKGKIAEVRNLPEGQPAVSPPTFDDLTTPADFKRFGDRVREITGGIPIGFKLSAQHIEDDIDFALEAGADYIILDGRGGGTGAAPLVFRDNISVPTIPALARARHHLDKRQRKEITLIITGGLRTPSDFAKALAMGADGIAIANSAMQAIGCVAARICNTNNCPAGIATQREELRAKLNVENASAHLTRFLNASTALMQVLARACGHNHLNQFTGHDITTWKKEMSELSGISFAGTRTEATASQE